MELATLICANTRRRAIEIAIERSLLPSAMQNELRYVPGTDSTTQWAYIDSKKAIFGRPGKSLIIFDDSARKLSEWQQILNYAVAGEFRCEWVGDWTPVSSPRKQQLKQQFIDRLNELGICAVCKKPAETVLLYEGPGLVHFIHGQGKECRVAVDMGNLRAALETLIKAIPPRLVQQRVPAEMRKLPGDVITYDLPSSFGGEWLGPGLYEDEVLKRQQARVTQEKREFSKQMMERALLNQLRGEQQASQEQIDAQMAMLEAQYKYWQQQQREAAQVTGTRRRSPTIIDPPKPVLPAVVSRTTVRKVKFD